MDLQSSASRALLSLTSCQQDLLILAGMLLLGGDISDGSVIPAVVVVVDEGRDQFFQLMEAENILKPCS